jgi:hypothetical protein
MGDPPAQYVWHEDPVPEEGLPVTQVYGWLLCPVTGRVLIQEQDDGTFSLPGGTPESPWKSSGHGTGKRHRSAAEWPWQHAGDPTWMRYMNAHEKVRERHTPGLRSRSSLSQFWWRALIRIV